MALLLAHTAHATTVGPTCTKIVNGVNAATVNAAIIKLQFGHINLTDATLQPDGTELAHTVTPASDHPSGKPPETLMWKCDKQAYLAGDVYFLVSTNEDSRYAGRHEVATPGIYGTAFKHVGLQLRMAGKTLTGTWQRINVVNYIEFQEFDKDMIGIRLQDIPPMEATLYKVGTSVPNEGPEFGCYSVPAKYPRVVYPCLEPNGYLQLYGPGLPHDEEGLPHKNNYKFWPYNGLTWGMFNSVTLSQVATCVVRSPDQQVNFGSVSVQQLRAAPVQASFSIDVVCNGGPSTSGTNNYQTAIGLQASPRAFAAAQKLELVDPINNSLEYLVSDEYPVSDLAPSGIAKGVGIRLLGPDGQPRAFVGQPGTVGTGHPRGEQAGWYPVLQGATQTCNRAKERCHRLDFSAELAPLPGHQITPGKVRATAHVLVKVQ